ncbi:hypothetical protein BDE40_1681 [Litoreibacter halocynthiae]|uniref:Uncharacterized protein n=1 Tax=Litoreibacter halocynthiae TaxID=1242689 RepID=A0A4R7LLG8_9RHOB|nr:hypothetical protein [Litoreibacter halocynthiae]TDT74960.1 hypothetical protein BDE40_1681 [Litoreibacter halocynthiae]
MCLAVYMGCHLPLKRIHDPRPSDLDFEFARWKPKPLQAFEFVYYFGARSKKEKQPLECSCLLSEHLTYTEGGVQYRSDPLFHEAPQNPFQILRSYCTQACDNAFGPELLCDDGGGVDSGGEEDAYERVLLPLSAIQRGGLIFTDIEAHWPWRHYILVDTGKEAGS